MNKYTSLSLSKWLQNKGFKGESEMYWQYTETLGVCFGTEKEKEKYRTTKLVLKKDISNMAHWTYPAYDILNDLCVKYAKELFGGEEIEDDEVDLEYSPITREILSLLQQGKKEEAEEYIKANSILK